MKPITDIPTEFCKRINTVFADIDDTISTEGKILPEAYAAMWDLYNHGINVVPITGRCAGWVDHIARMWPVKGVVGENGAFYAYMDYSQTIPKLKKRYYFQPETVKELKKKFEDIKNEVFKRFPTAALASDQPYREFDLAIDFCEDVPPLKPEDVDEIVKIYEKHGAKTKISSIHVNGWFGDYDKLTMTKIFAKEILRINELELRSTCLFIGDSPNDQPMFEYFPYSVGVKNIEKFIQKIQKPPAYKCSKIGGLGFAEMTALILSKRNST
jgi:HAD superfamily hydrolase (TIGR01484 family)